MSSLQPLFTHLRWSELCARYRAITNKIGLPRLESLAFACSHISGEHVLQLRDHSFPRREIAALAPCNFATVNLTACILSFYLP